MWWHGPHIFGWGMGGFGLMSLLFWLLVAALLVAIVRAARRRPADGPPPGGRASTGLTILEERYAKGEIQRDEYLQKKGDLGA